MISSTPSIDGAAALTVDEAHKVMGAEKISRASFYNAIRRNEVPHIKLGRRILIPRHAFLQWLQSPSKNLLGPDASQPLQR